MMYNSFIPIQLKAAALPCAVVVVPETEAQSPLFTRCSVQWFGIVATPVASLHYSLSRAVWSWLKFPRKGSFYNCITFCAYSEETGARIWSWYNVTNIYARSQSFYPSTVKECMEYMPQKCNVAALANITIMSIPIPPGLSVAECVILLTTLYNHRWRPL